MTRMIRGAALFAVLVLVAPVTSAQTIVPFRSAQAQTVVPLPRPEAQTASPLPQASPEQVGMSKPKLDRIHAALQQEVDQAKLPGTVVMVARKGRLVYADAVGFQDKQEGKPMTLDTAFRIYSMTKPLAAVGAMMLVEDGRIQLTDPVSKFLPAFKGQQVSVARADGEFAKLTYTNAAADREMTVQDLFRHSAGLAYGEITSNAPVKDAYAKAGLYDPKRDYDARALSPAEFVERLAKAPLAHQPGTVWEYSLAIDLLGRVVEAASGKRLADYLDERLFKPLKMVDTAFWLPPDKLTRLAHPFATDPNTGNAINLIDVAGPPGNDSGGAGAVSTAGDY